ncbi:MAG: NAD+ synthase [Anaerolineae bacterium]|jgi:NAD+ synthase
MELQPGTEIKIAAWLRRFAAAAGARGYVVGLSGGIDSACTAVLCQRAVGEQVLGVLMPCGGSAEDAEMAQLLANTFEIAIVTVELATVYDALVSALPPGTSDLARANIKPRLRMTTLYALAHTRGYLVAGTGNKSEIAVGYFTKYGDGGVDMEPLGELYKTQVRLLARKLGIPQPIIDRPPSAGLWEGQTDEDEMGITYEDLDTTLAAIEAGHTADMDPVLLGQVQRMIVQSAHKRAAPPTCPL